LIPKTRWRCISKLAICDFQGGDGWRARKSDNRRVAGSARRWNIDQVVNIAKLAGCKNFAGETEKFIFNRPTLVDFKPVERFENGRDLCGFRSLNNSASKRVLNLLEPVKLIVWQVVIDRVTVVNFRTDNGGRNSDGCFEVNLWEDIAKFTNVSLRFRKA